MERSIAPKTASASLYVPAIDGLRFVAIMLVFIHHFGLPEGSPLAQRIASRGWIGVEIFFAISAYLLYRLLAIELDLRGSVSFRAFYGRRFLRIYPLMVFFPIAMLIVFGPAGPLWAQRLVGIGLGLDNFMCWIRGYDTDIPFSAHLWTLSYELQLYAILPLAFIVLSSLRKRDAAIALVTVEILALAARWAFATGGAPHPVIWVTPFLRPESTLAGVAIAIWQPRIPSYLAVGPLLVAASLVIVGPGGEEIGNWTVLLYLLTEIVSGSTLLLTLNAPAVTRLLSNRPIVYLGKISFGLYVYHVLGIYLGYSLVDAPVFSEGWTVAFAERLALSLAITLAMGAVSYHVLERPFLKLKDRIAFVHSRAI